MREASKHRVRLTIHSSETFLLRDKENVILSFSIFSLCNRKKTAIVSFWAFYARLVGHEQDTCGRMQAAAWTSCRSSIYSRIFPLINASITMENLLLAFGVFSMYTPKYISPHYFWVKNSELWHRVLYRPIQAPICSLFDMGSFCWG